MSEKRVSKAPTAPGIPRHSAPAGSVDCHGHIFPSRQEYPATNDTMPLAPIDLYLAVHRAIGIDRGVLVQGGAYRHDNRAMLDALATHPDVLRGVALVPADATIDHLAGLKRAGVRALRFTRGGASRIEDFPRLAPLMRELGLHAELFIGVERLSEMAETLLATGVPIVLDHMAGPFDAAAGAGSAGFRQVADLLRSGQLWVKLTPQRSSGRFPAYEDVRGHFDLLIAAGPDRLVWGTDWPFPHMGDETPDPGQLLDLLFDWTGDDALVRRILVDNPCRLYGFAQP